MKYKLIKELPGCPVGTIGESNKNGYVYFWVDTYYSIKEVNNFPDWFQPIPDEPERWKPKDTAQYFYITSDGFATFTYFSINDVLDNTRLDFGNCFRTKSEAQKARDAVRELLLKMQEKKKPCEHGESYRKGNHCLFPFCGYEYE